MRWSRIAFLLLSILTVSRGEWSWGGDESSKSIDQTEQTPSALLEGEELPEAQERNIETNATVLDDIVDELVSSKQGRSLGGFDDVYGDPTIKDALDAGDDAEARNLIKGRLCSLGLVDCDDAEVQEKRYLTPDDVIYAQPVDIKPVGKPIASIPIRGPPRAYGLPQAVQYGGRPQKHPPKRVGYGGSSRPGFSDKYGVAGGTYQFSQNSALYNNAHDSNFVTKPPTYANQSPYSYENSKPTYPKGSSDSQTGSKTDSVVQQHVHHHYVHSDAEKEPKVIIKPVAIPVGSIGQLNQPQVQSHSDVLSAGGNDFNSFTSGGFKPMSGGYGFDNSNKPIYEPDTVYGSQYGQNNNKGSILTQGLPNQFNNNAFDEQKFGNGFGLGHFGQQNNEFNKKEGHVGSGQGIYNQGPATFGQSNNFIENHHEPKAQGFECVCVNYDQCPSQEVIGRRDDLYLPIDPRNKGSDIAALTEEQLDNLNKTTDSQNSNSTTSEVKKISKRETKEEDEEEEVGGQEKQIEPLRPRYPAFSDYIDYSRFQPTFGISFGLPAAITGPLPYNPQLSPWMRSIGAGGVNLGLVSANPLFSFQIGKNDKGEKVYRPLFHVHVIPNPNTLAAVGNLFDQKKYYLLNKHHYYPFAPPPPVPAPVVAPPNSVHPIPAPLNSMPPTKVPVPPMPHLPAAPPAPVPVLPPVPPPPHPHFAHPGFPPPPHYYEHPHQPHYSEPPHHHVAAEPHYPPHHPVAVEPHYPPHHPEAAEPHYPSHHGAPVYSPHHTNYESDKYKEQAHDSQSPPRDHYEYYDDNEIIDHNPHHRSFDVNITSTLSDEEEQGIYAKQYGYSQSHLDLPLEPLGANRGDQTLRFPANRKKREIVENVRINEQERQAFYNRPLVQQCRPNQVCCRRPLQPQASNKGQCGIRHSQGINGRVKTPSYVDGESEFGEYPWQTAILKKDPKESVYVCGGTLIDGLHIMTAAHCIKSYKNFELRVRLGEWDVNRDVEFFPYIERDIVSVHVHPLYYAGTLDNDLAILKMDHPVEWTKYPHISPACLPDKYSDYAGQRCWTTGWGKDAFGDYGKYQNILKEVDVPILSHAQCQSQLRQTRLGYNYELNPGFLCAGGEDGKDACKGDGGGPLVCERGGTWQLVGVVSWGIGCGQPGVPGVYVKVAQYLDWIAQVTGKFSQY